MAPLFLSLQANDIGGILDVIQVSQVFQCNSAEYLYEGLSEDVYTNEDKILIENIRVIGDLKNTKKKVSNFGAPQAAFPQWRRFIEAIRSIEHDLVCRIMVAQVGFG